MLTQCPALHLRNLTSCPATSDPTVTTSTPWKRESSDKSLHRQASCAASVAWSGLQTLRVTMSRCNTLDVETYIQDMKICRNTYMPLYICSPSTSPVPEAVGRILFWSDAEKRLVGAGAGPEQAGTDRTRHSACRLLHWPGKPLRTEIQW